MGYEYCQQFKIAHLLEGRTIDRVKFTDYEGAVGLSIIFTDGSDLYICSEPDEELWTLIFGSTSNWDNRDHCQLDATGYWGRRRGEWRKEDPGWKDRGNQALKQPFDQERFAKLEQKAQTALKALSVFTGTPEKIHDRNELRTKLTYRLEVIKERGEHFHRFDGEPIAGNKIYYTLDTLEALIKGVNRCLAREKETEVQPGEEDDVTEARLTLQSSLNRLHRILGDTNE